MESQGNGQIDQKQQHQNRPQPERSELYRELITKLRSLREDVNWTRRDLSERSGLAEGSIFKIEAGLADPRLGNVEAILRALGYKIELVKVLDVE